MAVVRRFAGGRGHPARVGYEWTHEDDGSSAACVVRVRLAQGL